MLTEKYYKNYYAPDEIGNDPIPGVTIIDDPVSTDDSQETSYEPGMVIIEEQTVVTAEDPELGGINADLDVDPTLFDDPSQVPSELAISFDGVLYKVPRIEISGTFAYGNGDQQTGPVFSKYPFAIAIEEGDDNNVYWLLYTPEPGTHTISAKIPDGKGIPKIIKMGKPSTIVNQVEEIIKSLGGTIDTKRRNLQNLISTLANMAENGEIGGKTEVKSIRGTYTWPDLNSMNGFSVTRRSNISMRFANVPDDYQASENKIVVWSTNVSPINVVWSNLQPSDLSISTIAMANPTTNSAEFDQLTVTCTIYYW